MDPEKLSALTLTHIQYQTGSRLHLLLAYASLLPILQLYAYNVLIFYTRELTICNVYLGQLINEAFNLALKRSFQQPRPSSSLGGGYGMPSSHSQFVGYLAIFIILHLEQRVQLANDDDGVYRKLYQIGAVIAALIVGYSRIALGYHTVAQVVVGLGLGFIFGYLYYTLTEDIFRSRLRLRSWLLGTSVARWLQLRDTWSESSPSSTNSSAHRDRPGKMAVGFKKDK